MKTLIMGLFGSNKFYVIAGLAVLGYIIGLNLSVNKEIKKNVKIEAEKNKVEVENKSLKLEVKEARSSDSLRFSNIQKMQQDFLVYRDSFRVLKKGKICMKMIINKKPFKKADTTIVNMY